MRSLFLVFFFIFIDYVYAQNNTLEHKHIDDKIRNNAASRLVNMTYELIVEAKLLQRQILPIQNYFEGQIIYEIGYVMGKIRERYKRMIEIYKQAHYMTKHLYLDEKNKSQTNRGIALKAGITMYYPINWIINMEFMRMFEVDIDKLIEVLENIPYYAHPKFGSGSINFTASRRTPPYGPGGAPPRGRPGVKAARTGEGPGYPPGGVKFIRSGPPSVLTEPPPSYPNEPPPIVPNEPPPMVPNEPPPNVPNKPPPSYPNKPPPSYPNEPPPMVPNEPPPSIPNEPPPSYPNEPPPSVPNEPPPSYPNEPPPMVPNEPPPSYPNEPPPSVPNEPPPSYPNEPPPDPARQSPEAPQSQSFGLPPSQPYESPNEPPGPPSWPTDPPTYGKTIRFGSADSNFRTEEALKQYYREMYRNKHDGMNDKYDNLY